jgi:hypothetical protein
MAVYIVFARESTPGDLALDCVKASCRSADDDPCRACQHQNGVQAEVRALLQSS